MSREDWERMSALYRLFLHHSKEVYSTIAQEIRDSVKGLEILDIGCGDGRALDLYAGSAAHVTAIDYSPKLIEEAGRRENPYRIAYEVHDAAYLPYSPRSFDAAVLCNVLDQISQPEKVLDECAAVLKDDGLLIIVSFAGEPDRRGSFYKEASLLHASLIYHEWTPETCMNFLEEHGWVIREHKILGKRTPYLFCVCRKKQRDAAEETVISTSAEDFYLPLMARIYTTEHLPWILKDPAAVNLQRSLPQIAAAMPQVSEYTMVSYASVYRSAQKILEQYWKIRDLPVINVQAGLNTMAVSDQNEHIFYELDEPDHLATRESLLPASWTDRLLPYHFLDERWIREIRKHRITSVFLNACGAFRNLSKDEVRRFLDLSASIGTVFVLFDADTSSNGGILVARDDLTDKTMPSFTIDNIETFCKELHEDYEVLYEENVFHDVSRRRMKPDTVLRMELVERLGLRKIFLLKLKKSSI